MQSKITIMQHDKETQQYYDKAYNSALLYVEQLARKILREHPNLDEFIMAMGSYSFTCKAGNGISTWKEIYKNGSYTYTDSFLYFKPLNDFISEWDSVLKITGEPMRFTSNSEKITNW